MESRKSLMLALALLLSATGACIVQEDDGDGEDDDGERDVRSCETICSTAQAGDCTTVTGNCDSFCDALERATPRAGCDDERQAYHSCLDARAEVCGSDCDGTESDLSQCLGAYCYANQDDSDCSVLVASFL